MKTILAVLALSLAPAMAFAACSGDHTTATMSCADGLKWDAETRACVPNTTS